MKRLYHVAAYFKDDNQAAREQLSAKWSEHLRQDHPRLKLAGMLLSTNGSPIGVMTLVEAEHLQEAQMYFDQSPYQQSGLYQNVRVCEVALEVGTLAAP